MSRTDIDLAYCHNPLDRAENRRGDEAWLARARSQSRILGFFEGRALMATGRDRLTPAWLATGEVEGNGDSVFLGIAPDGVPCFAAELRPDYPCGERKFVDARSIAMQLAAGDPDGTTGIVAQALALLGWHQRHRFCARCGGTTSARRGGYQRRCDSCGSEHFPRTDPVAIMLVVRGTRCLLGRQPQFPPRMWSALAGFVEAGERLEDAVRRETHEETGVRVGTMRYIGSQPWPFPSSLMLGFIAEAESEAITIDHDELEDARWFGRDEIAAALANHNAELIAPPPIAIARHLLECWMAEPVGH